MTEPDRREANGFHPRGRRAVDKFLMWAVGVLWSVVMALLGVLISQWGMAGHLHQIRAAAIVHANLPGHPVMVERVDRRLGNIEQDVADIKRELSAHRDRGEQ